MWENLETIPSSSHQVVRILQDFNSAAAEWTKLYKPIQTLETYPDCDDFDEYKYTFKMIEKYLIENIR